MVRNDLKVFSQCIKVVKTANQVFGMIKRTITHKTKNNVLHLYKSLVRPHLEYCLQVWRPYLKKDIDLLEGMQCRATKMILGWDKRCYQERLDLCNLQTLEVRGLRGDLIQVFKLLKGLDNVSLKKKFVIDSNNSRRGHNLKLLKPSARLDIRLHSFSHRVVNYWNKLPVAVVNCQSLDAFKYKLSRYLSSNSGYII